MNFGIVGLSLSHPYAFAEILKRKNHKIAFVWDQDFEKCRDFALKYETIPIKNIDDLLYKDLNGVFIETESRYHCTYALHFIERNIPVFIDKILTPNLKELEYVISLAKSKNSIIMSCSSLRYRKEYIELKNKTIHGDLGKIVSIYADARHDMKGYLLPSNSWQDEIEKGGGELINMGIHGLEPLCYLIDSEADWVYSHRDSYNYKEAKSEDIGVILIKFKNGITGIVNLTGCVNDYGFSLKVYGTKSVEEVGDNILKDTCNHADKYGYEGLIDEFIKAAEFKIQPIPYDDMEKIVRIMIASRISAMEERRVYLEEL